MEIIDVRTVRTFAMHPQSPMQKMVSEGTLIPLTDDEIVAEIRLLVDHLDNMHMLALGANPQQGLSRHYPSTQMLTRWLKEPPVVSVLEALGLNTYVSPPII
jgi:hypothetical protein